MQTKRCCRCKESKDVDCFGKSKNRKDGRHPMCKACRKSEGKNFRESHKEELSLRSKAYRSTNKESISEKRKADRKEHPEIYAERASRYYSSHREEKLARQKARRDANVDGINEKHKAYMAVWNAENKEVRLEWNRDNIEHIRWYYRERRKNDPGFRVRMRLALRLGKILRAKGAIKTISTMKLVGCSRDELVIHLQDQFRSGMSWNNYGSVWVVDHIKPCAKFNLIEESEQRECFNFKNLQPLFWEENLMKSDKYEEITISI